MSELMFANLLLLHVSSNPDNRIQTLRIRLTTEDDFHSGLDIPTSHPQRPDVLRSIP